MESGGEVAFIAQFHQGLDLDAFPGQGKGGGMQLAALLWALRNQADASQKTAVELLQAGGAKKITQLWSINAWPPPPGRRWSGPGGAAGGGEHQARRDLGRARPSAGSDLGAGVEPRHGRRAALCGTRARRGTEPSWLGWTPGWTQPTPTWLDAGAGARTAGSTPTGSTRLPMTGTAMGPGRLGRGRGRRRRDGDRRGARGPMDRGEDLQRCRLRFVERHPLGVPVAARPGREPSDHDAPDVVNSSWGYPDGSSQCYEEFETGPRSPQDRPASPWCSRRATRGPRAA